MFDSIVSTIDRILDLLGKGSEVKKRQLEIQKLEHELTQAKSVIEKPSAKEIQQYDPKLQELFTRIENDLKRFYYPCIRDNQSDAEDVCQEVFLRIHADLRRANRDLCREHPPSHVARKRASRQRPATDPAKSQVRQSKHKRYPRRRG